MFLFEMLRGGWEGGCKKMGGAGCCGMVWGVGTIMGAKDGDRADSGLGVRDA
jgi:hypothetical protein